MNASGTVDRKKLLQHPIPFKLPFLPDNFSLFLDVRPENRSRFSIISLLVTSHGRADLLHQLVNHRAFRCLVPLLKSPDFCPYPYLLAGYLANWRQIEELLKAPSLEAATSFYELCQRQSQLWVACHTNQERSALISKIRVPIATIQKKAPHLEMRVVNIEGAGYRLERRKHDLFQTQRGGSR